MHLLIDKAEGVTIGEIRRLLYMLEKGGYKAEALPSEIDPQAIKISREMLK